MRSRRFVKLVALFLLLTTGWLWAPNTPPDPLFSHAAPAFGQVPIIGDGGVLVATMSSVTITNTTTPSTIFSYQIPAAFIATTSYVSVAGTVSTTNVVTAALPLHLHCEGRFNSGSSPGTFNVGVNFGYTSGTTSATGAGAASVALVNGITPPVSLANTPLSVDVWLSPIATATGGNIGSGATVFLRARWAMQSGTTALLATETVFNAATVGVTNTKTANVLQVNAQWSTAANDNAINIYSCVAVVGN